MARPIDADALADRLHEYGEEMEDYRKKTSGIARRELMTGHLAALSDIVHIVEDLPTVEAVEIGNCDGCYWKAIRRWQRCSCCRRNPDMKDCYCPDRRKDNATD